MYIIVLQIIPKLVSKVLIRNMDSLSIEESMDNSFFGAKLHANSSQTFTDTVTYQSCNIANANTIGGFEVMCSNLHCITNNKDEIKAVMVLKPEVDVSAYTEVKPKWASTPLTETKIQVPSLKILANFAKEEGRGVAIYARASLQVSIFDINSEYEPWVEHIQLTTKLHNVQFVIGCLYKSPSPPCQVRSIKALINSVEWVMRITNENTIITGDFNLPQVQ